MRPRMSTFWLEYDFSEPTDSNSDKSNNELYCNWIGDICETMSQHINDRAVVEGASELFQLILLLCNNESLFDAAI